MGKRSNSGVWSVALLCFVLLGFTGAQFFPGKVTYFFFKLCVYLGVLLRLYFGYCCALFIYFGK